MKGPPDAIVSSVRVVERERRSVRREEEGWRGGRTSRRVNSHSGRDIA